MTLHRRCFNFLSNSFKRQSGKTQTLSKRTWSNLASYSSRKTEWTSWCAIAPNACSRYSNTTALSSRSISMPLRVKHLSSVVWNSWARQSLSLKMTSIWSRMKENSRQWWKLMLLVVARLSLPRWCNETCQCRWTRHELSSNKLCWHRCVKSPPKLNWVGRVWQTKRANTSVKMILSWPMATREPSLASFRKLSKTPNMRWLSPRLLPLSKAIKLRWLSLKQEFRQTWSKTQPSLRVCLAWTRSLSRLTVLWQQEVLLPKQVPWWSHMPPRLIKFLCSSSHLSTSWPLFTRSTRWLTTSCFHQRRSCDTKKMTSPKTWKHWCQRTITCPPSLSPWSWPTRRGTHRRTSTTRLTSCTGSRELMRWASDQLVFTTPIWMN